MRRIAEIPVAAISMDRIPLDSKVIMFAMALINGARFPPIRVARRESGGFEIRDGRHRWVAYRMTHRGKIPARFSDEPLRRI